MSRKIGLGDIHFDPDIDGDVDFDFFGDTLEGDVDSNDDHNGDSDTTDTVPVELKVSAQNNYGKENTQNADGITCQSKSKQRTGRFDIGKNYHEQKGTAFGSQFNEVSSKLDDVFFDSDKVEATSEDEEKEQHGALKTDMLLTSLKRGTEENVIQWNCMTSGDCQAENEQATSRELLRVAAGDCCGSPLSDSSSDSTSDLYSITDESLDYDNDDEFDSDSEITDVSPLSSANMSPLPTESPKRTPEPKKGSSPKLSLRPRVQYRQGLEKLNARSDPIKVNACGAKAKSTVSDDAVDLKLLAKAIVELEEERKRSAVLEQGGHSHCSHVTHQTSSYNRTRKNMTFTNAEVKRIEQENRRLLRRIIDSQKPRKVIPPPVTGRVASSAVNRLRDLKKIEAENLAMLKRLQAAKPTKELSREYLLGSVSRNGTPVTGSTRTSSTSASPRSSNTAQLSPAAMAAKRRGERSLSTGSICSPSGSCASSSSLSSRSRSLRLSSGLVSLGHDGQRSNR